MGHRLWCYRRTRDIFLVQRAMGHRQIASPVIYTHVVDEDLAEAMEGFPNRRRGR